VHRTVVLAAEQDEVVQRGGAAVRPMTHVVRVSPLWTPLATRIGAAPIADSECGADRRWDDARAPADVERLAGGIEDDADD
jgi:hypothetical protein